eukprot:EG_transcript_19156
MEVGLLPALLGVASTAAVLGIMGKPYLVPALVKAPPVSPVGLRFLRRVEVAGHSVLGTRLAEGRVWQVEALPAPDEVVVDPAGLLYIAGKHPPSRAGQASAAIYRWAGLWDAPEFPLEVRQAIQGPGQAKYYRYSDDRHVVHVVSPDIQLGPYGGMDDDAVLTLRHAYHALLTEALVAGQPCLRVPPLSAGAFSGPFRPRMPRMTLHALGLGFDALSPAQQAAALAWRRVQLCVFVAEQLPQFVAAHHDFCGPDPPPRD